MDDTLLCPICSNKLKTITKKNTYLHYINSQGNYYIRICSSGINHFLKLITDIQTKKVVLVNFSVDKTYSKFVSLDFFNKKSWITCFKNNIPNIIKMDRLLEPDFPQLNNISQKVKLLVTFI